MNSTKENKETQFVIVSPTIRTEQKTGFDFLYEMCKEVRNQGNARINAIEPLTDRASFIVNKLNEQGLMYRIVPFSIDNVTEAGYGKGKLINIEVFFPATTETDKSVFYTAHHDIANPKSENCQDNSASVCNLLDLCQKVSEMKVRQKNVYIVFTDCEETGGLGMNRLIDDIKKRNINVDTMLCLELTANGTEYWASCGEAEDGEVALKFAQLNGKEDVFVNTPYNESINARRSGLNAICIGSLKESEMEQVNKKGFCYTWALCHSEKDTFELSANRDEMSAFVKFLKRFINE
jgi:transcription initiation factor IIF auxiliary subunit